MKKVVIGLSVVATFALSQTNAQLEQQLRVLQQKVNKLQAKQNGMNKTLINVKKHDAGDNIKFNIDLRTAYDTVDYKVTKGSRSTTGDVDPNGIWTNKLILGMAAQPREDLVFHGSLGMYKTFGANNSSTYNPYQTMDWYGTNAPSNSTLRVREAYFLYMGEMGDLSYTASFGRRPSLDGFLENYREDNDHPQSPTAHNINMEFDGASFKFDFDKLTGISGLYFKLCLGRGNSKVDAKYPTFTGYQGNLNAQQMFNAGLAYNKTTNYDSPNMDLIGVIGQLYDDGQYKVLLNYFQAWNVMGANFDGNMTNGYAINMTDVGDMTGGSLGLQVSGIGDEWSDFLDDTTFFVSYAFSKTDPKGTHGVVNPTSPTGSTVAMTEMLGSSDSETGTSIYAGIIFPGFFDNDKIGLEYNHGSKYWRSFTYGEDTLVGSKLATRGNAYEAYYNVPLLSKYLTAQVRYTYIDYDYSGSNMFFGSTGAPMTKSEAAARGADFVDSASEVRLSLRYRY